MKRRLSKRKSQLDLTLDPNATQKRPPHKRSRDRKESKKKIDTVFTREPQWSDHETSSTVFSSAMMTKPKDFVRPVPTSTSINEKKSTEIQTKKRRDSFVAGPTPRVTPSNREKFKLNSESESEEEVYSPRKVLETMDLTKPPEKFQLDPRQSSSKVLKELGFPFKYTLYR